MKRLILCVLVSFMLAGRTPAAPEQKQVEVVVGDETVVLPVPEGFIEVTQISADFRQMAERSRSSDVLLLAFFIPNEVWGQIKNGQQVPTTRSLSIRMQRDMENHLATEKYFNQTLAQTKAEVQQTGMTSVASGKGYAIYSQVSKVRGTAPNAPETSVAGTASFVHAKGKILYVYAQSVYRGKADMDWAILMAKQWVPAIVAANPLPLAASAEMVDAPKTTPLHDAAHEGNKADVERLLAQGAKVDVRNRDGETPLMEAARSGKTDIVELLLAKGARADASDLGGTSALWWAASGEHEEIVALLLAKGAPVDVWDRQMKMTALHQASSRGTLGIVRRLAEKGADINATDISGETPLTCAARNGHKDVAELLIAKGANIAGGSGKCNTALHAAARGNHADIAELLLKRGAREDIFVAAGLGHAEKVNALLKADPKLANADDGSQRLIVWPAENGHTEVVESLIAAGAEVNGVADDCNGPALIYAAARGHREVVEVLLAHGAKIDVTDMVGQTPLKVSLTDRKPQMAEFLIAKGADVNFRGQNTSSAPLELAALLGYTNVVKLMLQKGAKIEGIGDDALKVAEERKYKEIVELLRKYGAK